MKHENYIRSNNIIRFFETNGQQDTVEINNKIIAKISLSLFDYGSISYTNEYILIDRFRKLSLHPIKDDKELAKRCSKFNERYNEVNELLIERDALLCDNRNAMFSTPSMRLPRF